MIDEILVVAFVINAASMCVEDVRLGSVPLRQALFSLFLATSRQILGDARGLALSVSLSLGDLAGLLILTTMVALGRTGTADLVFLVSLRILLPERLILRGASFLLSGVVSVVVTVAEASLANGLLLVLRHRALSLQRGQRLGLPGYLPESLVWFAPFAWLLPLFGKGQEEKVPFIPFLAAGAIIGVFFNTLLL